MSKYFSLLKGKQKKEYSGKKSLFERHVELLKKLSPDGKILVLPTHLEVSQHSWCLQIPYSFGECGYVEASDLLKAAKLINGEAFSVTILEGEGPSSAIFAWEGNQTEIKIDPCGLNAGIPVRPDANPEIMHIEGEVLAPLLYSASGGIPEKEQLKCLRPTFRRVYFGPNNCYSTDGILASICPIEEDQLNRCSFSFGSETIRALRKIDFPLKKMTFEPVALAFYFKSGINFFVSVDGDKVFDRSLGMPDISRLENLEDHFHPPINIPKSFWKNVKNFEKSSFVKLRNGALEDDSGTVFSVDVEPFSNGAEIAFNPKEFLRLQTLVCSGSQWEFSNRVVRITDACGDVIYLCGMKVA